MQFRQPLATLNFRHLQYLVRYRRITEVHKINNDFETNISSLTDQVRIYEYL